MIHNFLFHRVSPERDPLWDPMDIQLFEKCIRHISENYEIVLMEDMAFSKSIYSSKRWATIMFDDGYKDNILYALPILEKYNIKASFYIVTDCIDQNRPTWTHILDYSLQYTNVSNIWLKYDFLPSSLQIEKLSTKQERIEYARQLKPQLKRLNYEERKLVLDDISAFCTDIEWPDFMMSWEDLKVLKEKGHYIGSHTVSHSMLGTISDTEMIKRELIDSGKRIQEQLGHFPISLAYPIGSYNATTKELCQEAGYKLGLAVNQAIFNPLREDHFEIPRIELYNEAWWKTRLRISNWLERIKRFTH